MNYGGGERRISEREGERRGKCDRTDCDSKLYGLLGTTGVTSVANGAKGKEGITVCWVLNALPKAIHTSQIWMYETVYRDCPLGEMTLRTQCF